MPEIPLLGSITTFRILSASAEKLVIDGPLFTCNKINLNGWGIPEDEAPGFAATLTGMPVRWCPHGVTVVDAETGDITPAEHYCDLTNSQRAIVGKILEVYPSGRDSRGRLVYNQRAEITDLKTIDGIRAGDIPSNVSLWATGAHQDDDGMIRGCRGVSESIVTEPAYTEARFQWITVAASILRGVHMGASGAYVPRDPKSYGISEKSWEKPTAASFKRAGHDWDDPDGQAFIKSCAAVVTGDGSNFGDCHLFHHEENGDVSINGVNNAKSRLSQTKGIDSIRDKVEAHLEAHQTEIEEKQNKGAASMPVSEPEIKDPKQLTLSGVPVTGSQPAQVQINIGASAGDAGAVKKGAEEKGKPTESDGISGEGGPEHNAVCAKCNASIPRGADFCPKCGAALHPKCASCGCSALPGAKFCSNCGGPLMTTGDNTTQASAADTVKAAVDKALAEQRETTARSTLAASIIEVQTRTGVLQADQATKAMPELLKLPASVLETQLTQLKLMAAKIEGPQERGLGSGSLPQPEMIKVGAGSIPKLPHGMPGSEVMKAIFQRFTASVKQPDGTTKSAPMTWDDIVKFGCLKNVGGVNFSGTYHQERVLLPL